MKGQFTGPAPGKKLDPVSQTAPAWSVACRCVAFVTSIVIAMGIFATVTLIPPYADLLIAEYDRDLLRTQISDMEALIVANDRLIAATRDANPVLTRRLAMRELGIKPDNEIVTCDTTRLGATTLLRVPAHRRPHSPPEWVISVAAKLRRANIRRGLLVLSAAALVAGLLMFPVRKEQSRQGLSVRA